ncbi:MAG: hypothetical protein KC619_29490 [Myxococcales bacterium]|nr:hypothetical protein [Myxococcales bacterium]
MQNQLLRLLCVTVVLSQGCAAQPGGRPDDAIGPNDLASDEGALRVASAESSTYYTATRDYRRCAWPFCGGFWVSEVNHAETTCPDGSTAEACYVTDLDLEGLALNERDADDLRGALDTTIFRGEIGSAFVADRDIAVFVVSEAWQPLTEGAPVGDFFKVVDNGIRCITTPCYTQEAAFLNYPWWFTLDQLETRRVDATDEELATAFETLATDGILVAGWARARFTRTDVFLRIRASQIYLPVRPSPVDPGGVVCGGFAGIPCPGHGACMDDPTDSCDPAAGGADCTGLCECYTRLRCAPGYHFDESPEVCGCVEDAPLSPCATVRCAADTTCEVVDGTAYCVSNGSQACGSSTCGAGSVCCNASCGICTPPGAACIQIACL